MSNQYFAKDLEAIFFDYGKKKLVAEVHLQRIDIR